MGLYPIFEPIRSADPTRFVKDFKFWQKIKSSDSIYKHPEGAVGAAIGQFGSVHNAAEFFSHHFPDLTKENIGLAIGATGLLITLGTILRKKFSKKPLSDFADEDLLIKYLTEEVNKDNAAEKFREESLFYQKVTGKILGAVADHLEGKPGNAAIELYKTIKKYHINRKLKSLLSIRCGKTLAASGDAENARKQYDWVIEHSEDIEMQALAYREMLNIDVQRAWTYFQSEMYSELSELHTKVKYCIEQIATRLKSPNISSKTKEKLGTSLREFQTYYRALDPAFDPAERKVCLAEIVDSIDDLAKIDFTTGINRRTQAATLMIRWNEPERAIDYIQKRFGDLTSSLERAAAKLVEGQAQKYIGKLDAAHKAFLNAEENLEETQEVRFWRDTRQLRIYLEESPSDFLQFGIYARRYSPYDHINGAFVMS